MTAHAWVAALAAGLLGVCCAADAAEQTCDQRLGLLQFKGAAIRKSDARQHFDAALSSARMDRTRGDEKSCQADLDEAERALHE